MILKLLNRIVFAEQRKSVFIFVFSFRYSALVGIYSSQERCFSAKTLLQQKATQKLVTRQKQKSEHTQALHIRGKGRCLQNQALQYFRKQGFIQKEALKFPNLILPRGYGTQKELVIAEESVYETAVECKIACAHVHPSGHVKIGRDTWVNSYTVESLAERDAGETAKAQKIHVLEWRWMHLLDYPSVLRWCGDRRCICVGMQVHHDICCNNKENDTYIGVVLVEMYLKWEASDDAHSIYFSLRVHSVFSWNLMIRSYTSQGQDAEALQCLQNIHGEALLADKYTFVSLLSSCVNIVDIGATQRIHACIVGSLHQSDVVVGNALINAYAKCGSISEAQTIFNNMSEHDSFSWDTLIGAYVQHKLHNEALCLFCQQQHQGVLPTRITYVAVLDACASQGVTEATSCMLARIFGSEYKMSVNVATAIVNFFGKLGHSEDAWRMFCLMHQRNSYSWNAIFASGTDFCQMVGVFELYSRMLGEGVLPNEEAFIRIISLCTSSKALAFGKHMHACIMNNQDEFKIAVGNALIGMYSRCAGLKSACRAFDWMLDRNIVSWTTLVSAFVEHGQAMLALEFFYQMLGEGLLPDKIMLISILDACASLHSPARVKQLHVRIVGMGLDSDPEVGSSLASMYGKCGGLKAALRMLDSIFERNTTIWTAMISAHARHNHGDDAIQFFHQMKQEGILPNEITFFSVLDACSKASALMEGRRLHAYLSLNAFEGAVSIKTALIDMYGKCGSLDESQRVFDDVVKQDIVLLTTMIAAYTQNGKVKQALLLFDKVLQKGMKPDEVAFINVLSMCSHAGLVDDGRRYFSSMSRDYGIMPTIHHYSCMIDLFGRAGCLTEAENMIMNMPFTATALQWMTLLSACRRQLDVERGERAARHVMLLDPKSPTPYVELANIYGALNREADAVEVLKKMKELL